MYAIVFDLDAACLAECFGDVTCHGAYKAIRDHMLSKGFTWMQGNVYFGQEGVDAVACVLAVQELATLYPWFGTCVKDLRMLRVEENSDLMPAVRLGQYK